MKNIKTLAFYGGALLLVIGAVLINYFPPAFSMVQVATRQAETAHDLANRTGNDKETFAKLMPYRDGMWGPIKLEEGNHYRVVSDVNARKNPDKGFTVNARLSMIVKVAHLTGEAVPVSIRGGVARNGRTFRFTQAEFTAPRTEKFMLYVDATGASEVEEIAQVRLMRINSTMLHGISGVLFFLALGLLIGGIVVTLSKK